MTLQPTSTDASVQQLMSRMHEIETRRRMSMMHCKEAETKVSFATEEQQRLDRELDALKERETVLKQTLQLLSDEQRQLQIRSEASHHLIHSAEKEEPLLMRAALVSQGNAETCQQAWIADRASLDAVSNKWGEHTFLTSMESRIATIQAEIVDLCNEEQRLTSLSSASTAVTAHATSGDSLAASPTYETSIEALAAQVEQKKKSLEEFLSQGARQKAIIGRELKELTSRAEELEQWIADSMSTVDVLQTSTADLNAALQGRKCSACLAS